MKKFRTYAVLASIAASVSMLAACSDNDSDDLSDTGAAVETPATQSPPPVTSPAPATTQTPPATTPAPETTQTSPAPAQESSDPEVSGTDADGSADDSAPDITPEPDSQ